MPATLTRRVVHDRWLDFHDDPYHSHESRQFARLLASAAIDGEDLSAVDHRRYRIDNELADEMREQIAAVVEYLRAHPDCAHRWWSYTSDPFPDGYRAPIKCLECNGYPTSAEADAWWTSEAGESWVEQTRAERAEIERHRQIADRVDSVRDAIGAFFGFLASYKLCWLWVGLPLALVSTLGVTLPLWAFGLVAVALFPAALAMGSPFD